MPAPITSSRYSSRQEARLITWTRRVDSRRWRPRSVEVETSHKSSSTSFNYPRSCNNNKQRSIRWRNSTRFAFLANASPYSSRTNPHRWRRPERNPSTTPQQLKMPLLTTTAACLRILSNSHWAKLWQINLSKIRTLLLLQRPRNLMLLKQNPISNSIRSNLCKLCRTSQRRKILGWFNSRPFQTIMDSNIINSDA